MNNAGECYSGGSGTKSDPYQISTAEELAYLAKNTRTVNSYTKNKYFVLTNDIILNDGYFEEDGTYHDGGDGLLYEWADISGSSTSYYFCANFDGKGYSISGAYINQGAIGFFGRTLNCLIQNLNFEDCYFITNATSGGIVGSAFGASRILNCSFDGTVKALNNVFGGILGYCQSDGVEIRGCSNYADIISEKTSITGIVGGATVPLTIQDCKNYGYICGSSFVGGITSGPSVTVENCYNYGKVEATTSYAGGISSFCSGSNIAIMRNCANYGEVISAQYVGGIVGAGVKNVFNCKNYGNIKTYNDAGNYVGGIVGYNGNYLAIIHNCVNYGVIRAKSTAAGMVGASQGGIQISNCSNYGEIVGQNASGMTPNLKNNALIKNCNNRGIIRGGSAAKSLAINIDSTSMIYDSIAVCKLNNVDTKIIYANNMSSFYKNDRTGYIGLRSRGATTVWMTSVDEQTLINNGFTVYR